MAGKDLWIFSEKASLQAELIAGAHSLAEVTGGEVVAIVVGDEAATKIAFTQGANKVFWLGEKANRLIEDFVPTIAGLVQTHKPCALLIGASKRGKAVAGKLGAALGITVITDVKKFFVENETIQASHLIFGGGAMRVERAVTETMIATLGLGIYEPLAVDPLRQGEVVQVPFVEPKTHWGLRERKAKPPSTVNLAAAKKVVCAGRGLQKKEDLDMVFELAGLLEAEVGATRPLCEGLDWLPRERYIGVSGAFIKPDLYLGIGVSGQAQHTVGITETRVIVAVNKDEEAPLFEQADYGIVGDLYTIVPELIKALKARK